METGYLQRGNARRRGFESKDPFTLSIARCIQQNRAPLQGIDDIPLLSQTTTLSQRPARQSYGSQPIHRVHAPQVIPPPVIPSYSVPAVSSRRSGQRAQRDTSPPYEMPLTISSRREDDKLPPNQSRNRLQSRPLSAIPLSPIPQGALIDNSHHYRPHSHNPPLVHHHDHRSRSKSPAHRESRSPDRGRSRSPRRRPHFQQDPSPLDHHSTHYASSYIPHRVPESNPSNSSISLFTTRSPRVDDIGSHFEAYTGIHAEPETEVLPDVKTSPIFQPGPSLPSAMSSRRTEKERELREGEQKERLREHKEREYAIMIARAEGRRQGFMEYARERERQTLERHRERDRQIATATAQAALAAVSANARRSASETSETSSDAKPSSLRSYLHSSNSPVPPQPYIPMPCPPPMPTPTPVSSSSIIPPATSMPESTAIDSSLVNARASSRSMSQPNFPARVPAHQGRQRRLALESESSASTMTAVDSLVSFPPPFLPERTLSSESNPPPTRVAFPGVPASTGSHGHGYHPPSGTTSRLNVYSRPTATGGGSYSATGGETLLGIPEDASLRISSPEIPFNVELPSNATSPTSSIRRGATQEQWPPPQQHSSFLSPRRQTVPMAQVQTQPVLWQRADSPPLPVRIVNNNLGRPSPRTTTSSGRRGEETPTEPDSPVVPPVDAESLPPGFVPQAFTPHSATPTVLSANYSTPEFAPTAPANSARSSIISSYEIGVEPPSKPAFPVFSNHVKYEKPATPNVHLEVKPTDRPSSPEADHESLKLGDYVKVFVSDTLPRQMYLHILLRLPYFYFARVERIFKEADLALEEIIEMALQSSTEDNKTFQNNLPSNVPKPYYDNRDAPATNLSPGHQKLKKGWENFIDSMMREWKTLNLVSALILPAIMTMLQIEGIAQDPVTRYLAFWSLICALLSLLFCCTFTIRFAGMRKANRAAEWALEVQNAQTIFWNPWVMLAMPVVWLAWSIITYILCIMFFMWRVSAGSPTDHIFSVSPSMELGFRIFICFVLFTGIVHGVLIISTLRRYGADMDKTWTDRVERYIANPTTPTSPPSLSPPHSPIYHFPNPSTPHSSKTSLESDSIPYINRAIPTSADSPPVTQFTSIPHHQPFTTMFPTETESGRIRLPPPHEFSRSWTPPPTQWERTPSHPPSSSSSSDGRRKRRTPSSRRRRSSSNSSTSPHRRRHRSIQDPQSPSILPTLIPAVRKRGQWESSHDEIAASPSTTPPIQWSPSSHGSNTTRSLPLRRSPSHLILLQPANQPVVEGEGELHPLQGDEDDQGFGFTPLSRLAGHSIDLFSDPNPHTPHIDTIQWTGDGDHPEGLTPASRCQTPEAPHPSTPPSTSGNTANNSIPSECVIPTALTASDWSPTPLARNPKRASG